MNAGIAVLVCSKHTVPGNHRLRRLPAQISDWWSGKAMRFFLRVNAEKSGGGTGTYELYRLGKSWFLSRILD